MATPITPWDRRPKESEEAYAAFLAYRDAGRRRSIAAVGQGVGKSGALLERWSSRWHWVERSLAWDNHLRAERDRVEVRELLAHERRKRREIREGLEDAAILRKKFRAMADWPLHRVRKEVSKDD